MSDLPDWLTQTETTLTSVTNLKSGLDADKSASPVVGDVYLATDTGRLYACFSTGTWQYVPIPACAVTMTNVTASRAVTTIYQNTSGRIKAVSIMFHNGPPGAGKIYSGYILAGASSPPMTYTSAQNIRDTGLVGAGDYGASLFALIPPNYYYRLIDGSLGGGVIVIDFWTEWTLL